MEIKKPLPTDLPLRGRTVLVTRPRVQAAELSGRLRAFGAQVVEAPAIRIADPPDRAPLLRAASGLENYDWVVLTSVNGVSRLARALRETAVGDEALLRPRVAAIGPATARAARAAGLRVEVVPSRYRAEALLEAILEVARRAAAGATVGERRSGAGEGERPSGERSRGERALSGRRVLLARAAEARDVLPAGLREAGAEVEEVPAYVSVPDAEGGRRMRRALESGELDWITFTSSSTVRCFVQVAGARVEGARVAAIGPITAETVREAGLPVHVVAREYTIPGLVAALARAERGGEP